jgi:hypothetical protein
VDKSFFPAIDVSLFALGFFPQITYFHSPLNQTELTVLIRKRVRCHITHLKPDIPAFRFIKVAFELKESTFEIPRVDY